MASHTVGQEEEELFTSQSVAVSPLPCTPQEVQQQRRDHSTAIKNPHIYMYILYMYIYIYIAYTCIHMNIYTHPELSSTESFAQ